MLPVQLGQVGLWLRLGLVLGLVFTRATLASAGMSSCRVSVHLSIRLSQVDVLLKRLNVGSRKLRHTGF